MHPVCTSFLCRQIRAVREDCWLAAPGVDSEPRDLGEPTNSENYSAIAPQTARRLRSNVLEFLRFWTAWRRHLSAQVQIHVSGREPAKKRMKKIFSRATGLLSKSRIQYGTFITNCGLE